MFAWHWPGVQLAFWSKLVFARKPPAAKALPDILILAGTLPNAGGRGPAPRPFPIDAPGAIHAPRPADWFVLGEHPGSCLGAPRMRMTVPATYQPLYGLTAHLSPETE